ncbi:MAG TPA: AAA family ATPase [Nocardioides sp.]|nr:AAA family ATPase [Nocardioides sp.]
MPHPVIPPDLIGRGRECSLLGALVHGSGPDPVVLIHGEAGIGKSALVGWTLERAAGETRTLYAAGAPSERALPFAGLHQLLRPLLGETDRSPFRRHAVHEALRAEAAAGAALFRTAMAVLDLLAEVASERRLVIVADDVQWLDRPSRDVVSFVGRRLGNDPVALLLAARDPMPDDLREGAAGGGWKVVEIGRLSDADAADLLDRTAPTLSAGDRRRVLDEAAGNPLALIELPKTVSERADAVPTPVPVNDRLMGAFASRLPALPENTRRLCLLTAAHDSDSLDEVLEAGKVDGPDVALRDLEPAVTAGLLVVAGRSVRFGHPLARSAVYQRAGPGDRQSAHRALSRTAGSPDRRAWHAAAAAVGPDESVAAQLDAVAERASRTGASETALRAYEAAARVSEDAARRAGRMLRAVELAHDLGHRERTLRILGELDTGALEAAERPRLDWIREVLTGGAWSGGDRVAAFVAIARRMSESGDRRRAMGILVSIGLRAWWSNLDPATRLPLAEAADDFRADANDPIHLFVSAMATPLERGREALSAYGRVAVPDLDPDPRLLLLVGLAGTAIGDQPRAVPLLAAAIAESRRQGRTGVLTEALLTLGWTEAHLGRLSRADVAAEEGLRLAVETGQTLWRATGELACAATQGLRGSTEAAEELASAGERVLLGAGANPMLTLVQAARGFAALGAGRYDDAYAQLCRPFTPVDVSYHQYHRTFLVAELAEAAAHCGRQADARRLLADVEPLAEQTGSPILHAGLLVARPLLADEDDVERLYLEGLADGLPAWPLHRARLLFGYGVWLRRQRRIAEARYPLRTARETFAALGAAPWAERAGQELRAAGEAHRQGSVAAWEQLTSQELQIATMAAEGLTNRQIGERLFLSHRTVGAHLYHIFPKLGIASRSQLGSALAGVGGGSTRA